MDYGFIIFCRDGILDADLIHFSIFCHHILPKNLLSICNSRVRIGDGSLPLEEQYGHHPASCFRYAE